MKKIIEISWEKYGIITGEIIRLLIEKIDSSLLLKPDIIIGISRGGLPIAISISYALNVPLEIVSARITQTNELFATKSDNVQIKTNHLPSLKGKRILIVDDLIKTGKTIIGVLKAVNKYSPKEVNVATLFKNKDIDISVPIYSNNVISDEWIIFPYEIQG